MKSHKTLFEAVFLVAVLTLATTSAAMAEEPGGFVKRGQSLRDLRIKDKDAETPAPSDEAAILAEEWPLRFLGLTTATLAVLAVLFLLWRRRRFRAGASEGGARLEILDKIALSTRQWVCILRVDEKRVVVGVSGDTMTSLAVLDDDSSRGAPRPQRGSSNQGGQALKVEGYRLDETGGASPGSGVDRSASSRRESMRRDEGSFWFRPDNGPSREAEPSGSRDDVSLENHLAPYRREVNRLRATLQNWRQTTERGERSEKDRGEGQGE